jgi:hypothetical protein
MKIDNSQPYENTKLYQSLIYSNDKIDIQQAFNLYSGNESSGSNNEYTILNNYENYNKPNITNFINPTIFLLLIIVIITIINLHKSF